MTNIKVAVRIRPISEREMSLTGSEIVVHTDGNEVSLTNLKVSASKAGDSRKRTRRYGFDYCFNSATLDSEGHATQEKVYESLGTSALDALFSGFNACLVAYGQSASGKTYTMMGPKNDPGLTPRLCEGLFFRIFEEQQKGNYYDTAVSYLEIYNERVRDLLKPSTNSSGLRVREHPRLGPYVQGLTRQTVSTLGSLMSWVEEGTRARKTASTTQNATSSRSHALLTVSLTSRSENSNSTAGTSSGLEKRQHSGRGARLHLVDLAGSERAGNSNYGLHRLKEGANINKSLVALGNVISALAERGATRSGPGRRFIPYRDSALTWLLKDALGGNATTIMLATISPASGSYNETAHTLRFAHRAQSVVNRPVVNEDPVARVIRELRAEISRLTSLLSEKEIGGESATSCCCKQKLEAEPLLEDAAGEETSEEKPAIRSEPNEIVHRTSSRFGSGLTLHRKYSSEESLSSKRPQEDKLSSSPCRFGSLKSLNSSEEVIDPQKDQDRTRISTVSYDRVDALALVDIPTLVAVLIKPEDDQSGPVQIEEITGENILESSVDVDAADLEELASRSIEHLAERVDDSLPNFLAKGNEVGLKNFVLEEGYVKQPNATDPTEDKKSGGLNVSKKFGSSESFASSGKGAAKIGLGQRSYTHLQLDKGKSQVGVVSRAGKVKRTWSPRGSITPGSPKKLDFDKDGQRQRSSKEAGQQKTWNSLPRKQESDSPKRRVSKDDSVVVPALKTARKGSVGSEVSCRTSTPIQRTNRRAKIVAAVTERLYSAKKSSEDTLAGGQGTEFKSPESAEVKLANATRMKLQEISRKMFAKRRKTCADTQTDVASTVRVKDTASITDDPKVETKDVAVVTDLSEDCQQPGTEYLPVFPVTRVKEMATLTERFAKTVRCKDAGVVTEDCDLDANSDYETLETWASRNPSYAENSTNTTLQFSQTTSCTASQTCPEDLLHCSKKSAHCHKGCDSCHGLQECCHQVPSNPVPCGVERSVICITLPDMLSITIESPNSIDSKIAVTEANASSTAEERVSARVRDEETQTKGQSKSPRVAAEDLKMNHILPAESSPTVATRSASCQSDGRTFRIENIFEDPKSCVKVNDHGVAAELMPDLTEHVTPKTSLKLTNSVGTSFGPETSERSTEIEGVNFFDAKIARQSRRDTCWRKLRAEDLKFFDTTSRRPPLHSVLTPVSDTKYNFLKPSAKLEAEELKSPLLVAKMIANSGIDVDSSFSDDSLDPEETSGKGTLRMDETLCPPDVVAHTKKEPYESRIEEDFAEEVIELPRSMVSVGNTSRVHDYEALVLGRNCFIPIVEDSGDTSRIETPESEEGCRGNLKKRVSFSNSKPSGRPRGSDIRRPKPIIKNALSSDSDGLTDKKPNASTPQDCSASEASFRDDISSISESSETVRSAPLYNSDEESDALQAKSLDLDMKRVRFTPLVFGERGESGTSDSDGCENAMLSDEESPCCDARMEVFASYLDEATAFVHNMNTMNEFFGANMTLHDDRDEDFIEYQGRRVSLKDDTDEYLKQEEFDVPIDSYRNCLRGIEKLENCIDNAVQHDKFLFGKCGLSLESAATSFNLVDPGQAPFHHPENLSSSFEELACVTDEETPASSPKKLSSDVETRIFQQLMEATSPRRLARSAKPYFRRSTRVSDLRVKSPRPRRRHHDPEEPKVLRRPGDLEVPRCFLTVPEAGRDSSGREYRSDGGTSSSDPLGASSESIDTVASVRNGFRYPGSPRAKLMQLVSERRQIVHRSRSEAPSPR
ncbi:uncharacterized protein LOC107228132 [Neodiprion lecontei]|uniref:Uncharacterized protein LOC107228132 n=1 Tax=Neodiprion lecontei TaxID=441921 RepID=A0ABM3FXK6_NEOLC|nr:uncharacterized protein LOC107228132 [Neodiprion lecontei]